MLFWYLFVYVLFMGKYYKPYSTVLYGLPRWLRVKNSSAKQEMWVQSLIKKIPWRRKWQTTPVFLLGKSHGQRSLVGYSPWGCQRVRHDSVSKQQEQQQYYIANCVSWVPKLALPDLWTHSQHGSCLHTGDLLYSIGPESVSTCYLKSEGTRWWCRFTRWVRKSEVRLEAVVGSL